MTPREAAAQALERAGMLTRAKAIRSGAPLVTATDSLIDCLEAADVRGEKWLALMDALAACVAASRGSSCERCPTTGPCAECGRAA